MYRVASIVVLMVLAAGAGALAVPEGMVLEFTRSPVGRVVFDGTVHQEAGFGCEDCHNPAMFPEMKRGSVDIRMKKIYAGEQCGVCHDGEVAFTPLGNCTRCHLQE